MKVRLLVLSLPTPNGGFQRFSSSARRSWRPGSRRSTPTSRRTVAGIDDRTATIHADLSHLGFHASIRSSKGAWYIDPYYHLDQDTASYYGRPERHDAALFVERDADSAELSIDKGYYHASDTVTVSGSGFAANADVTLTISDPEGNAATARWARAPTTPAALGRLRGRSGRQGSTRIVTASDGDGADELPGRPRRRPDRRPAHGRRRAPVPAGPHHRPGLRDLPRRARQRHGGEGHAHEPRQPGLRGRPLDPHAADREQRPLELRHLGRGDRPERAVRRGRVLHPGAGHGCSNLARNRR